MAASHYRHRRTSTAATPFPSPVEPGEIVVNTANRQLVVGDAASASLGQPLPLLAVRIFDPRAQYAAGEFVISGSNLYRAKAAVIPAAFNAAQWDLYSSDVDSPTGVTQAYVDAGDAAVTTAFQNADASLAASTQAGFDAQTTAMAAKADKTYVDSQNATQNTTITGKADKSYVDTQDALKVAKAGDTMTGDLRITEIQPTLILNKTSVNNHPIIHGTLNGVDRWAMSFGDNNPESGGDTGAYFSLFSYTDAGAFKDIVFQGNRANGLMTVKADPTTALGVATKQYVDAAGGAAGAVRYDAAQVLTDPQRQQARANIYAAPFDALAHNGLQFNGGIDISQERGQTGTNVNAAYICDGWQFSKVGTMVATAQQYTGAFFSGYPSMLLMNVGTAQPSLGAGDLTYVFHQIEGYRCARLGWGTANAQPITLCFWSAHHRAGLYTGTIRNAANNRTYAFSYTQAVADIAQYNTITIPGDTTGTWAIDNTQGLCVSLAVAVGTTYAAPSLGAWLAGFYIGAVGQINAVAATSDVFRITGVTVHPGSEAPSAARSPFILRPYDDELRLSKRYYQKLGGAVQATLLLGGYASAYIDQTLTLPVEMRAAPTVSVFGTFTNTSVSTTQYYPSTGLIGWQLVPTAQGNCQSYNNPNSGLIADARL